MQGNLGAVNEPWTILCDAAEVAVECADRASALGLAVEPRVSGRAVAEAVAALGSGPRVALALLEPPGPDALVALSSAAGTSPLPIAMLDSEPPTRPQLPALARDLGLAAVTEVGPLMALLALASMEAAAPWAASTRPLSALDRRRLSPALATGPARHEGQWEPVETGHLGYATGGGTPGKVGEPRDVAAALTALREATGTSRVPMPQVEGVERQAVMDVIFGPRRELSDPASKAALAPYDLPMPVEELCTSASRAASEASRIGFPVRIALASPDLRIRDHPDLAIDGVDNAARVREIFRQLMALGQSRLPEARLLGVTVSATTPAHALLRIRARPLPEGLALCEVAFADPHGLACDDRIQTVLPAPPARLELALSRLRGSRLLLEGTAADRRKTITALGDVLLRLAAFVHDWRDQIESVTFDPLALLLGGGIEVREACVAVGDAFERSLAAR